MDKQGELIDDWLTHT